MLGNNNHIGDFGHVMSQGNSNTAITKQEFIGHDPKHFLRMFPDCVEEKPIGSLITKEQRAELIAWRQTTHINSEEDYQAALEAARTPYTNR